MSEKETAEVLQNFKDWREGKKVLQFGNRKIEVLNPQTNDEGDLMQDFVSIITSFVARLYGRRRSKRVSEKIIEEVTK